MNKKYYITTTLPYVNADPHVGFAMEIIRADAVARYQRSLGKEVFFNTGTDEHGAKVFERAQKEGIDTQTYTDRFAARFRELGALLNLSVDNFIRTTDEHHLHAAQEFWKRCDAKGDIYKKFYKIKYCTGCELEKTESELVDGHCPIHPGNELEIIEEENYFFKFSNYTDALLAFYDAHPDFIIPNTRFNETKAFVARGLQDFSISRLKSKMPWGVPVPGDDTQVMYVWFDALVNYISTLGWPEDSKRFEDFWIHGTPVQYCGKDNNRQQSAMWQAMLMSADLPNTHHIVIDGFINGPGGVKMSKSIGNVISPFDVIDTFKEVTDFPEDALRFVLLHDLPAFEDGDLSIDLIKQSYATHLANGIGNLTSRILKMATTYGVVLDAEESAFMPEVGLQIEKYDLTLAMKEIQSRISAIDEKIATYQPFKTIKEDEMKAKIQVKELLADLAQVALTLEPFLPRTAAEIQTLIRENRMPERPLFARLS